MSRDDYLHLVDPRNVNELKERDRIVRRVRQARRAAEENKATIEHWNRMHPNDKQFDTELEDGMIAWCDGVGPWPAEAIAKFHNERAAVEGEKQS